MVPQHGHGAVGEAARIVMVTSLVIHTCSITRSERSGMMVIGSYWIWKTSRWRICLVIQYTTCGISEPAEEPLLVTSRHVDKHWSQKSASHILMSEHVGGARRAFPHAKAHPAGFGATAQLTRPGPLCC